MESALGIQAEHPFKRIHEYSAQAPARDAEVTNDVGRWGKGSRHGSPVIVIPFAEVGLGCPPGVDRVINNGIGCIDDFFTGAKKAGRKFCILAGNPTIFATDTKIEAKSPILRKLVFAVGTVHAHRGMLSEHLRLISM